MINPTKRTFVCDDIACWNLEALRWLKANNPFYHDIQIDMERIENLPVDGDVGHELPTASELNLMEPEERGPSGTGDKLEVPAGDLSPEFVEECDRRDVTIPAPSSVAMCNVTMCRESVSRMCGESS